MSRVNKDTSKECNSAIGFDNAFFIIILYILLAIILSGIIFY